MARPLAPRGQGRSRVIQAALELFAEHGVSGTSLQMIADRLGVTKAAVYYQFRAKEEIVLAVVESALEDMRTFVVAAEEAPSPEEATHIALRGLVDLVIRERQAVAALTRDPEIDRIVKSHEQFETLTGQLTQLLLGPDPTPRRRVAVSLFGAGLPQPGIAPELADLDETVLREELLRVAETLLA